MSYDVEPTIEDDFFSELSDGTDAHSDRAGNSDKELSSGIQYSQRAKDLTTRWGWSQPTPSVMREAELHTKVQMERLRTLDIMVELGLINKNDVGEVLKIQKQTQEKKNRRKAYDIAAEVSSNKQLVEDSKNRVLAAANAIQYIDSIDNASVRLHEAMFSDSEALKNECLRMNAVLCRIQGDAAVIIFSEFSSDFKAFMNMGRAEKQQNIIFREIGAETRVKLALAHPEVIANATKNIHAGQGLEENEQRISIAALLADKDKERQKFGALLKYACSTGASDVHIDPKEYHKNIPVIMKVHGGGRLVPTNLEPTMDEYHKIKDYVITIAGASDSFGQRILLPKDGQFVVIDESDRRFNIRCSFIPDGNQFTFTEQLVSINMRIFKHGSGAINLEDNNVPEDVIELLTKNVQLEEGTTYVVGPTGSGKSTTVFGMIEKHRQIYGTTKTRLSFEDPIENDAPGIQQTQVSKRAKIEYENPFTPYEKQMLRHAPNLILFGEVRDGTSAIGVGSASATGHYVLSTLHARTPASAIERLLNMVPAGHRHMVIENIGMIIGQRLVSTLCPHCTVERECTKSELNNLHYWLKKKDQEELIDQIPVRNNFRSEEGCAHCRFQGTEGVAPIYEVVDLFPRHKKALLQPNPDIESIIHDARNKSMQKSALELLVTGKVDIYAFLG